jgi:hypothetical protein
MYVIFITQRDGYYQSLLTISRYQKYAFFARDTIILLTRITATVYFHLNLTIIHSKQFSNHGLIQKLSCNSWTRVNKPNVHIVEMLNYGYFTQNVPCPCRAHAVLLPCRVAKGLDCVFPTWFTQCGRVWFTLTMPCPCRGPAVLRSRLSESDFSRPMHSTVGARHGHGMVCVHYS